MQHLSKGYNIDEKYIVAMFLKEGMYNENYRVLDHDGKSFFMKLYDIERVPGALRDAQHGVKEVAVYHQLKSGSVPTLCDEGMLKLEGQQFYYLITEYFGGELLSEVIARKNTLSVEETLQYTLAIAEWLKEMHAA